VNAGQTVEIRRALTLGLLAYLAPWLLFSTGFYRETQYVIAFWQALSAALVAVSPRDAATEIIKNGLYLVVSHP